MNRYKIKDDALNKVVDELYKCNEGLWVVYSLYDKRLITVKTPHLTNVILLEEDFYLYIKNGKDYKNATETEAKKILKENILYGIKQVKIFELED